MLHNLDDGGKLSLVNERKCENYIVSSQTTNNQCTVEQQMQAVIILISLSSTVSVMQSNINLYGNLLMESIKYRSTMIGSLQVILMGLGHLMKDWDMVNSTQRVLLNSILHYMVFMNQRQLQSSLHGPTTMGSNIQGPSLIGAWESTMDRTETSCLALIMQR